eukprot:TRINITY_DN41363_c0_g1_i1.p1 TRINITY_DN41363_c0_g1~~TRINITY_DN41363_c0_g1_i1.p1  ORF type:complete len:603 (+),score=28.03 TRINITY_DN41363_c0_g1_i1:61-1809(+)
MGSLETEDLQAFAREPFVQPSLSLAAETRSRCRAACETLHTIGVWTISICLLLGLAQHFFSPVLGEAREDLGPSTQALPASSSELSDRGPSDIIEAVRNMSSALRGQAPPVRVARPVELSRLSVASATYKRSCTTSCDGIRCEPVACSLPTDIDLGLDMASMGGICTYSRICMSIQDRGNVVPGDVHGNPIVCGQETAGIGRTSRTSVVEATLEWTAADHRFVSIELWGGGGGGAGSHKIRDTEDASSIVFGADAPEQVRGLYIRQGFTATGRPWYGRATNQGSGQYDYSGRRRGSYGQSDRYDRYLFWDPDCSGYGYGAAWFVTSERPDSQARSNLVRQSTTRNECRYLAKCMDCAGSAETPLGARSWRSSDGQTATIRVRPTRTQSWICGGGGGGASRVKALLELLPGHRYRIEVGRGGRGSKNGKAAESGMVTRFLEVLHDAPVRVLAEASGGFGAGPFDDLRNFTPAGKGGLSMPQMSHSETNPGLDGESSWTPSPHSEGFSIEAPGDLVRQDSSLGSSWLIDSRKVSSDRRYGYEPLRYKAGVRQPCDGTRRHAGCPAFAVTDFFLTCNDAFNCTIG